MESFTILLIEDSPKDTTTILRLLRSEEARLAARSELSCVTATCLRDGIDILRQRSFDLVILDLCLPDCQGLAGLDVVRTCAPNVPVVVSTRHDKRTVGLRALKEGAQDYFVKRKLGGELLGRIIRYAIERHRQLEKIKDLSIVDDLTGLHNRRGFSMLGEQQLKVATRSKAPCAVFFIDMDGLKAINDGWGHSAGDHALCGMAQVLKSCLRDEDLVARLGGDEFVFLARHTDWDMASQISERVQQQLCRYNDQPNHPWKLKASIGYAIYDPYDPCAFDELLARADAAMYRSKLKHRESTGF